MELKKSSLEPLPLTIRALCFLFVMQESLHSWSLFTNQNRDSNTKLKLHSQQLRAIRSFRPPTGSFAPKQCFLPVSIKFTSCPRINGSTRKNPCFYVSTFPFFKYLILSAAILCFIVPFFQNSDNICDMDTPSCHHGDFFEETST